jgi:hypothetical protein
MPVRFGQKNEGVPSIVKQRDEARGEAAARQNMRLVEAAKAPFTRRRTMMRRCRLERANLTALSLACQPWPASTHSRPDARRSIARLTLAISRSLNK